MKNYYRVMLGRKSAHAEVCLAGGFIGADFDIDMDLAGRLPEEWRAFNHEFIPIYMAGHPEKTKIGAGLACGFLWTVCKGIQKGDVVLCPDGTGTYRVGEVTGDYEYHAEGPLPHRRAVRWLPQGIDRAAMSVPLRNSAGSIGTVCDVSRHRVELEGLIASLAQPQPPPAPAGAALTAVDAGGVAVEDPWAFAMEKHLEEFLVRNWAQTDLGRDYDIYEEDGEQVGQQYPTDTGPLDILAISKDQKRLLVVELKRGRASDAVVGQTLRYMGYVQEELAEEGQAVQGVVIALEDDPKIRRALAMVPAISFYRYQISFKLVKV